jgi:ribonuclease E
LESIGMAEQNQTDDRWRELADLLGLPGDGPAPAPAPPIKAELPPAPPALEVEEERPIVHEARIEQMSEGASPGWESEFDEGDDDTAIDESLLRDEPAGEEPAEIDGEEFMEAGGEEIVEPVEGGSPVSEEDKPRRGRRRRRRGRRGGREGEERPPQAGEPRRDDREPRRQPEPEPRERGRGDRRRDEEPRRGAPPRQERREPVPVEADDDTPSKPAPAMDAHDDTDFSNWNVPSWQDLIASLYRPDR